MINDLRALLSLLLEKFEQADGSSADAYWDPPLFQPMAAGKYLSAVAALVGTRLLKAEVAGRKLQWSLAALQQSALPSPGGEGRSWGLGFPWRNLPTTEPFLITSALVTRGLCEAAAALPQQGQLAELAQQSLAGLSSWCTGWLASDAQSGSVLPAYSPGIRRAIYNAAAAAWSVLLNHHPERYQEAVAALHRIWACRIKDSGWCYEAGNGVIDLLHQAYLYGAMRPVIPPQEMEPEMLSTFSQFSLSPCWMDVVHLLPQERSEQIGHRWARHAGPHWLVLDARPARLWSLGELLLVLSEVAGAGDSSAWMARGGDVAAEVLRRAKLPNEPEMAYARHTMHLAHGLAVYIATKRAAGPATEIPTGLPSGAGA